MRAIRTAAIYLAAGLIGGFALSALLRDDTAAIGTPFAPEESDASLERRMARLESRLDAVVAENAELAAALQQLDGRLVAAEPQTQPSDAVRAARPTGTDSAETATLEAQSEVRERFRETRFRGDGRNLAERLTEAGFSAADAERIETRLEELSVEAMQSRYEALRSGEPQSPIEQLFDSSATLRAELGDADYERYLEATGRPTRVGVTAVLASSAAESAGIEPGDQIIAYNGQRVFDVRELNQVLLEGEPGEPVVVDIERDGQPIQLVIPRGPLGISSGFAGRMNR